MAGSKQPKSGGSTSHPRVKVWAKLHYPTAKGAFSDTDAWDVFKAMSKIAVGRPLHDLPNDEIINAAKNPKNGMHPHFRWNLKDAAYHDWLETASYLRRAVGVTIIGVADPVSVPLTGAVQNTDGTWLHLPHAEIAANPTHMGDYIQQAVQELEQWERKYRAILDMKPVKSAYLHLREALFAVQK